MHIKWNNKFTHPFIEHKVIKASGLKSDISHSLNNGLTWALGNLKELMLEEHMKILLTWNSKPVVLVTFLKDHRVALNCKQVSALGIRWWKVWEEWELTSSSQVFWENNYLPVTLPGGQCATFCQAPEHSVTFCNYVLSKSDLRQDT